MQDGKFGVTNLLVAINALGEFATVLAKSNGGTIWQRVMAFGQLADEVTALLAMDFGLLANEWKERSEKENEQLKIAFKEKFDLPNDAVELMIEEAFGIVLETTESFKKIYDFGLKLLKQGK